MYLRHGFPNFDDVKFLTCATSSYRKLLSHHKPQVLYKITLNSTIDVSGSVATFVTTPAAIVTGNNSLLIDSLNAGTRNVSAPQRYCAYVRNVKSITKPEDFLTSM